MSQRKAAVVMIGAAVLSMTTGMPAHATYYSMEGVVVASTLRTQDVSAALESLAGIEPAASLLEMLASGPPPVPTPSVAPLPTPTATPEPPPVPTPTVDPESPVPTPTVDLPSLPVATPPVEEVGSSIEAVVSRHDVTAACVYTPRAFAWGGGSMVVVTGAAVGTGHALASSTTVRCEVGHRWTEFSATGPVSVIPRTTMEVDASRFTVCVTAEVVFVDGHRVTLPRACRH